MSAESERDAILALFAKVIVASLAITLIGGTLTALSVAWLSMLAVDEVKQCREEAHRLTATDTWATCNAGTEMTWRDADTIVCVCPKTKVEAP